MTSRSSSVSRPHFSLTLPLTCFQLPSKRFQSIAKLLFRDCERGWKTHRHRDGSGDGASSQCVKSKSSQSTNARQGLLQATDTVPRIGLHLGKPFRQVLDRE